MGFSRQDYWSGLPFPTPGDCPDTGIKPAMNTGCMYLYKLVFLFLLDKYPSIELLDHMVVLFLAFFRTSILFYIADESTYTPTHSVQGFPFLHILAYICFL